MKINKRKFREGIAYHAMVMPMLIMFILFIIYPFCSTIFYSFTDYSSSKLFDYEFVGLKNYLGVFDSANQIDTIVHTLKYAAIITVVQTIVALILALALTSKFKTNNFLRTVFFFPAVLSPLVVGYLWSFLFSTSAYGPINNILEGLGLAKINFFGDPELALYSVLFTQVWQWSGYSMVIIIANLKSIDPTLYEVSSIDGASKIQQFFHITLPMLYPSMNVLIVTGIIGGLKVYDIIVSTTGGGPFYATTTIVQSIISQAIGGGQYGLGAALNDGLVPQITNGMSEICKKYKVECVKLSGIDKQTQHAILVKEYEFWQTKRMAPNGLNYYGNQQGVDEQEIYWLSEDFTKRSGGYVAKSEEEKEIIARTVRTFCESGWDCTSRFELDGHHYNPVDLNALLYGFECCMKEFSDILGNGESLLWSERAEARKEKMNQFLWNEKEQFYMDWNFDKECFSPVASAASLYPLFFKMCDSVRGEEKLLHKLLLKYGISATEPGDYALSLQWDYPNVWAPLQYMAFVGCKNYGYEDLAKEIAMRYTDLLEKGFEDTGNLWEKYDGNTGLVANQDYKAPAMMGWTAGVYIYFKHYLDGQTFKI